MYRVEGLAAYPSYPERANFSYIFLQNVTSSLHEKQKAGSGRRMTRLIGSPFCGGKVTLLAGLTFLHINTMAHPATSTWSGPENQYVRQRFRHRQRGQLFSPIDAS